MSMSTNNTKVDISQEKQGVKFDSDKPRMDLVSPIAIEELAKVLAFGSRKYNSWNWAQGIVYSRLLAAALRHIFAYMRGESKDPESGLSHISHAMCNLHFLSHFEKYRPDLDDRPKDVFVIKETK